MTCTTCHRVNPRGGAYYYNYNCGALYFGLIALITVALYTNPALTIA